MVTLEECRGCPGFTPFLKGPNQQLNVCSYVGKVNYSFFREELCPCKTCLVKQLCGRTKWKDKAECDLFITAMLNPRLYRTHMVAKVHDMAIFPPNERNIMDLKSDCKGCLSYTATMYASFCSSTSLSGILSFVKVCPCRTCLVKGVCQPSYKKHSSTEGKPYCEMFLNASRKTRGSVVYG